MAWWRRSDMGSSKVRYYGGGREGETRNFPPRPRGENDGGGGCGGGGGGGGVTLPNS